MRKSKLRQKLNGGGVARIAALGSNISYFPHMAAHFGFDAVWVCAEHHVWDGREAAALISQHLLADIDCLWRPATTERAALSRYLEDGAAALLIPMVNDADHAEHLARSVKFPPLGDRGLDGAGIDGDFYIKQAGGYCEHANRETMLIVQIESPQALENVESIAAVPGVDGLFIGPGDLSLRLGCSGSILDPKIHAAAEKVAAAAAKHGKPWGFPVNDIGHAKEAVRLGCRLLAFGNEFWGIHNHLKRYGEQLDELFGTNS